ncbi:hypothetical protein [Kitasatospora sp. NBC_01266]|uniref:hypothetical protein n=1 Tax=Kitasatospora sp. NBC_01266 TaxID=2903572 RepID=UPI002E36DEBD|nr:hypothetical protein [Kitasatospora sp. NBC_01266]
MGYEFHITRAEFWPESSSDPIGVEEWEALADSSTLLREDGYIKWVDIGRQKVYAIPGEAASFSWRHGRVDISGRYTDGVQAVAEFLADALTAHVFGDDE